MKTKTLLFSLLITALFLVISGQIFSQEMQSDPIDDEAIRNKEQQAEKKSLFGSPDSDPYYEDNIKNSWDNEKGDKTKAIIEELKKEYGTDVFNKEVLDRGPKKKEESKDQSLIPDPYYEENIKGNISNDRSEDFSRQELKKEVLEMIKNKVYGKQPEETKGENNPLADSVYESDISKSKDKEKAKLLEGTFDQLKEGKAIETKEDREKKEAEKLKKEEEEKKAQEAEKNN